MTRIDLTPATDALATVVAGVRDDQLDDPTPCEGMTVVAVLDHIHGFAWAFDCAARKETGYVGLDEVVVHSWDLARATGQDLEPDPAAVEGALRFVAAFASEDGVPGLFGPKQQVPEGASRLEELLALTGRDPAWRPGTPSAG